jgi:hypothetical protein
MATSPTTRSRAIAHLRAKAALYDELVERLAQAEDAAHRLVRELDDARRSATRDGIDPAWRDIANDLAHALRPYSMFGEQVLQEGRLVVHTRVPAATLGAAAAALDRLARQVAEESHRADGIHTITAVRAPGEREAS